MTRAPDDKPNAPTKAGRIAREAAALRANLLKRKDQARQREEVKAKPKPER
jgi:hypothetical protein